MFLKKYVEKAKWRTEGQKEDCCVSGMITLTGRHNVAECLRLANQRDVGALELEPIMDK